MRALLPVLLLCACGDPLVDAGYRGEPLITIAGEILQEEPLGEVDGQVLVSVFWGNTQPGSTPRVEQSLGVQTEFPSRYRLEVFQPPAEDVIFETPDADQRIGVGLILLYVDQDGDEAYSEGSDTIIGTSRSSVLIWVDEFLTVEDSAQDLPDEGSFILGVTDPQNCQGPPDIGDPMAVSLIVGQVCESLADLNCDARTDEWGEICGGR